MGLDAHVACTCIRDGIATPHPFPDLLEIDEYGEAVLKSGASDEQWIAPDRWVVHSCEHGGFLASERLGNVATIAHVRSVVEVGGVCAHPDEPSFVQRNSLWGFHLKHS